MVSVGKLQTRFSERLSGLLDRYNDLCNGPVSTHEPNQLGTKATQSCSLSSGQQGDGGSLPVKLAPTSFRVLVGAEPI